MSELSHTVRPSLCCISCHGAHCFPLHDGLLLVGRLLDFPRHRDVLAVAHERGHSWVEHLGPNTSRSPDTVEVVGKIEWKVKQHNVVHLKNNCSSMTLLEYTGPPSKSGHPGLAWIRGSPPHSRGSLDLEWDQGETPPGLCQSLWRLYQCRPAP